MVGSNMAELMRVAFFFVASFLDAMIAENERELIDGRLIVQNVSVANDTYVIQSSFVEDVFDLSSVTPVFFALFLFAFDNFPIIGV